MFKFQILKFYSQPALLDYYIDLAKTREFCGTYESGNYSKRPGIVSYPQDIVEMVKAGVVSFHTSVEHWSNVAQLAPQSYDRLRTGWDFVCDVDSSLGIDEAKIATELILDVMKDYGVKNPGLKFSGRRGFHIGIPFEAFPKEINYKPAAKQYPEVPQAIASFIREKIRDDLLAQLIEMKGSVKELFEGIEKVERLDPYYFVEVEKNWGERHLFRAPYSLHHKTWLVSMPLNPKDLSAFQPEHASPENVIVKTKFLEPGKEEATDLLTEALDWWTEQKKEEIRPKRKLVFKRRVDEEFFPPCIKLLLKGLRDGMHRSTFTLVAYLRIMNWKWEEIEKAVLEWNRRNDPPLPEAYLSSQLKWHARQMREILPANCDNDQFFGSIGLCQSDDLCKKVKNPASYPFRKLGLRKYKTREKVGK